VAAVQEIPNIGPTAGSDGGMQVEFMYAPGVARPRAASRTFDGESRYTLDGFGGVHPFAVGSNPMPRPLSSQGAYWAGDDVAVGIAIGHSGTVLATLDSYGGVHVA
jgi:hypothetical protein